MPDRRENEDKDITVIRMRFPKEDYRITKIEALKRNKTVSQLLLIALRHYTQCDAVSQT